MKWAKTSLAVQIGTKRKSKAIVVSWRNIFCQLGRSEPTSYVLYVQIESGSEVKINGIMNGTWSSLTVAWQGRLITP
jgi:hypothetical protein